MGVLAFRSHRTDANASPGGVARLAHPSPVPRVGTEQLGRGAVLCFIGLALAAATTILSFLGTGLWLLVAQMRDPAPPQKPQGEAWAAARDAVPATVLPLPAIRGAARATIALARRQSPHNPSELNTADPGAADPIPNAPHLIAPPDAASPAAGARSAAVMQLPAEPALRAQTDQGSAEAPANPDRDGYRTGTTATDTSLPAAEIRALLAQGDAAFGRGDVTSARLLYQRAFEAGDARGALGIGASYDPVFLRRDHLWTQFSDPEKARFWYRRARGLGSGEAEIRLLRLEARPAR